jgi:hypothetical protein
MQFAQLNLETAEVMAWTVTAIILTAISDLIFDALGWFFSDRRIRSHNTVKQFAAGCGA